MSYGGRLTADAGASAGLVEVRRHNLALVLAHLRSSGARSRATIAAETGLTRSTVSSLVAELAERGLVAEGATARGGVGRPSQPVDLDGAHFFTVGAEVDLDHLAVTALDVRAEVVAERWVPLDAGALRATAVLGRLAGLVGEVTAQLRRSGRELVGITLAVPGLVEQPTGRVLSAPNLGWADIDVVDVVRGLLDEPACPLLIDNEANLAARAEVSTGDRVGVRDLVLLTGGIGVGAGVVAGGHLLRGVHGFAGEVGHMQLDPGGQPCGCGRRGCWETQVGLNALLAAAADEGDAVRDPALDVRRRLETLAARAEDGDARTLEALERTAGWLGAGAGVLVNLFNPELLVLGGYFAVLGRWLADPVAAALPARVFAPRSGGCRVEPSTLGYSAAARGGALEALSRIFADPTAVAVRSSPPTRPAPVPSGAPA
ncbi:ROK family transcriptional regulator [Microlunatus flavus]|uniref:Sugar kinase of the NBD/HSP70 family, may contain an N-terminal HTH domain n=1 Tax=Microlunatus flavus TaxID=1036181 RepID=A0A1H9H999_9ACTN|nr:ROK family transcriptional regulator [Microlunatus flavus]SEQ58807.1 Sugar kinase of the NBD/HSP70 family, may contain an N-terminal HTH domain [Microlunatus flavus]